MLARLVHPKADDYTGLFAISIVSSDQYMHTWPNREVRARTLYFPRSEQDFENLE